MFLEGTGHSSASPAVCLATSGKTEAVSQKKSNMQACLNHAKINLVSPDHVGKCVLVE